jgi:hypothetical protein
VLVVASGQSTSLFDLTEVAFDDLAAGVAGGRVEADRAAARGTLAALVGLLVRRLGDAVGTPRRCSKARLVREP